MLKVFGATLFGAFIGISGAYGADLPSRVAAPAYAPLPVFSWTGFYAGAQIGYEFGRDNFSAPGAFPSFSFNQSGVAGGAHFGYQRQYDSLVFGIEGDVNGSSYGASTINPTNGATVSSHIPVDGSVRGRIGYAVDRTLFYATGGVAFADIQNSYLNVLGTLDRLSHTGVGYTVGGGIAYAMDPTWSLRAEYRYTDYGRFGETPGTVVVPRFHHETDNRVQAGVSYKFGEPFMAPVVARY